MNIHEAFPFAGRNPLGFQDRKPRGFLHFDLLLATLPRILIAPIVNRAGQTRADLLSQSHLLHSYRFSIDNLAKGIPAKNIDVHLIYGYNVIEKNVANGIIFSPEVTILEIKRDYYLNKLSAKKHNGLIKVITGMRRCGKSYLLFNLFKQQLLAEGVQKDHIIEIAFDSFENKKYRDPEILYPHIKSLIADDEMYYILLDEVQLLGEFESVLNGFMRISNADVYVTGSNAKFLSKDIITEFRGRGDELHMNPLSFAEFMSVYDGNKYDGWNEYMLYGGLPSVVLLPTPEQKIELLKRLFDETYINDIVGRHRIRNKDEFEELINILSSGIGS